MPRAGCPTIVVNVTLSPTSHVSWLSTIHVISNRNHVCFVCPTLILPHTSSYRTGPAYASVTHGLFLYMHRMAEALMLFWSFRRGQVVVMNTL